MSLLRRREPAGTPSGGRFAVTGRAEGQVTLPGPVPLDADATLRAAAQARAAEGPHEQVRVLEEAITEHLHATWDRPGTITQWDLIDDNDDWDPGSGTRVRLTRARRLPATVDLAGTPAARLLNPLRDARAAARLGFR